MGASSHCSHQIAQFCTCAFVFGRAIDIATPAHFTEKLELLDVIKEMAEDISPAASSANTITTVHRRWLGGMKNTVNTIGNQK